MISLRKYQKEILEKAKRNNVLVVLPTGTGKTYIAISLALERLELGNVLFLAPTKPLVEQHYKTFSEFVDRKDMNILTGEKGPPQRKEEWGQYRIVFATPQTVRNDLRRKRISLENVSLVIYDEAHRAVGKYAYVDIQEFYRDQAVNERVLAMTASPGHTEEKIYSICNSLDIKTIESRGEDHETVKPYVKKKEIIKINLELPPELRTASDLLRNALEHFKNTLKEKNLLYGGVRKRDLISLQKRLISQGRKEMFYFVSIVSSSIKVWHAVELLEMYGKSPCLDYLGRMGKDGTQAGKRVLNHLDVQKAVSILENTDVRHPKISKLKEIIEQEKGRIIVFTQYRTTARALKKTIGKKSRLFVGQARMKQEEQIRTIEQFENKEFQVLIATSIGEEGLHIPDVETAIFFEPVPSALRMIQRKGRVGRTQFGKVYVMVTKNTSDESYYWTASRKEKKMKKSIKSVEEKLSQKRKQKGLGEYE